MKLCQLQSYQHRIKRHDFTPSKVMEPPAITTSGYLQPSRMYDSFESYYPRRNPTIPSHVPSPVRSDNRLRDCRVFPLCELELERGLALFASGVRTGTTLEQRDPRPASFHTTGRRLTPGRRRHAGVVAIIACLDKCCDLVSVRYVRA